MQPQQLFPFCPQCGSARSPSNLGANPLRCEACGFHFYFNPTLAAAAFLFDDEGLHVLSSEVLTKNGIQLDPQNQDKAWTESMAKLMRE